MSKYKDLKTEVVAFCTSLTIILDEKFDTVEEFKARLDLVMDRHIDNFIRIIEREVD